MPNMVQAGFPEMWRPVHETFKSFFEAAVKLQPVVERVLSAPAHGDLEATVQRMVAIAANSFGAVITLVLNGYGADAMRIVRGIFETELNILYLKSNPSEVADYLDYDVVLQKQMYDELASDERNQVSKESYDRMMAEYNRVLPRFVTRGGFPRNDWCRVSIYERAKAADMLPLYRTMYKWTCSMHHGDIGGQIFQIDAKTLQVDLAPSWSWLEDALIGAHGSFLRCLGYYDEMANLGFKNELESGPNEDYVQALKRTGQAQHPQ
jgi:hypothetical protein